MMGVHRSLADRGRRVLTPDLPGFERSERHVPDYSVRAHGRYLITWLDSLGVDQADFVAYSMSGGVVLEAYQLAPERFRSLVMLSAIGVQELELTGDYTLNHVIHGLQVSAIWLVVEGIPHFGYLDDAIVSVQYARNFYETDQRPLRGFLRDFQAPMEIIHDRGDAMVPYAAAVEHARLVPQASLVTLTGRGHGWPFMAADSVAALIDDFVGRVDRALAPDRAAAAPDRTLAAAEPFDASSVPPPSGLTVAILMFLVAAATMASEDLASIGSGLMAAQGTLTFVQAFLAALVGIVVGDMSLYLAGRWLGRPLVERAPFRWFVSSEKLAVGEKWFDERGIRAVLLARFVPGTRLPTYVAAGVLRAPFFKFFGYFLVAALLWTPAIVGASMLLGRRVLLYYDVFEQYAVWVVAGLAIFLFVAFRIAPLLFSHAGRRRLAGKWLRVTTWEFWPAWVFYPPVVLWCFWLAVRNRSLLAFTAANPGIPHSGFVGESKRAILDALPPEWVASYTYLPAGVSVDDGAAAVADFMTVHGTEFPVVLKPDVGERGRGVTVARSESDVRRHLSDAEGATIAQTYVPGSEYGVFYYRDPDSGEGIIFSVTDKRFPSVTGDGKRSIHELILEDPRAIAMLPVYEQANAHRLDQVLPAAQTAQLVELGTHCRGAVFLDGSQLITPTLTRALSEIAGKFEGFHFGRFDVRVADAQALAEGRDFRIIELNGVTSEATHIYAPGTRLLDAYRVLFKQWELAFQIGASNRKRGAKASSLAQMTALLLAHIRRGLA
ncbi:MAG: membrane protein DedA with SNARE-associated domain/pimeloyl-ACP methyl ester carboxylesterase [Rhodothermales bacterium]|jgi:membrane protein DedA with SNARE-associated domain/pimeloyl-ACP methyl ester carboxylesterase